jgi:hyperosmotically inducible protein
MSSPKRLPKLTAVCLTVALAACGPAPSGGTTSSGAAGTGQPASPAAAQPHPGSAGRAVDDAVLTTRVKSTLLAESSLNAGDISVSSSSGQVTLSGTVPAEQIARADAIVRKVDGVSEVINALTPKTPLKTPPS